MSVKVSKTNGYLYYGTHDPQHVDGDTCPRISLRVECPECGYPMCESRYILREGNASLSIGVNNYEPVAQRTSEFMPAAQLIDMLTMEPLVCGCEYQDKYGNTVVLVGFSPPMFEGDSGRVDLRGDGDGVVGYSPTILDAKFFCLEELLNKDNEVDKADLFLLSNEVAS